MFKEKDNGVLGKGGKIKTKKKRGEHSLIMKIGQNECERKKQARKIWARER